MTRSEPRHRPAGRPAGVSPTERGRRFQAARLAAGHATQAAAARAAGLGAMVISRMERLGRPPESLRSVIALVERAGYPLEAFFGPTAVLASAHRLDPHNARSAPPHPEPAPAGPGRG